MSDDGVATVEAGLRFGSGLVDVGDDLIRRLADAKSRTELRNNPSLRVTEGAAR